MLLGADPEVFVINEEMEIQNALDVLPNSKKRPVKVDDFKLFYDNIAVEFNFSPVNTEDAFVSKITNGINCILKSISPYKISLQAYTEIDKKKIKGKNVYQIDCRPDLNAYTLSYNKTNRRSFKELGQRSCGGHIHIGGYNDEVVCDPILKPVYVYMLDLFLALPCVLMANTVDEYKRRVIHGKAGTYRTKAYGLEYRTLSSFWLRDQETIRLVFKLVEFVNEFMENGSWNKFWHVDENKINSKTKSAYNCFGYDLNQVQLAINECDYNVALKHYKLVTRFLPDNIIGKIEKEISKNYKGINHLWK